jgi:hypothetical protein
MAQSGGNRHDEIAAFAGGTNGKFGTNQFGFNINWASGQSAVVEARTDLANPGWSPVATNTFTGGLFYFRPGVGLTLRWSKPLQDLCQYRETGPFMTRPRLLTRQGRT